MAQDTTESPSNIHTNNSHNKRKRPPTFQYHPEKRAKKLKKEWIEKEKMKAKWRAQKRREGLGNTGLNVTGTRLEEKANLDEGEDDSDINEQPAEKVSSEKPTVHHQGTYNHRAANEASGKSKLSNRMHLRRNDVDDDAKFSPQAEETSLRELRKKAYSHSSLHTYKSDPLRHRNDKNGSSRKVGSTRGKGGQPNMKLRMEAMLEKIKRDIT